MRGLGSRRGPQQGEQLAQQQGIEVLPDVDPAQQGAQILGIQEDSEGQLRHLDLQVTLGIDLDQDGIIDPEADPAVPATDEWLFNDASEASDLPATKIAWQDRLLFYLRVNTLARTDRPDLDYVSEPLDTIEDRDWNEPAVPGSDQARRERMHRRRLMQTTIDLRNLS